MAAEDEVFAMAYELGEDERGRRIVREAVAVAVLLVDPPSYTEDSEEITRSQREFLRRRRMFCDKYNSLCKGE